MRACASRASLLGLLLATLAGAGDPGVPAPSPLPPVPPSQDPGLNALVYSLELSADHFCPGGRTTADAGRDASSQSLGLTVRARSGVGWRVQVGAGGGALRMFDVSRPNVELGVVGFRFDGTFGSRRSRVVSTSNLRPPNNPGRYRVELRAGGQQKAVAEFTVGWDPASCPRPHRRRQHRHPDWERPPPGYPGSDKYRDPSDPNFDDLHGPPTGVQLPGSVGPDDPDQDEPRVPEVPQKIFQ